jgi:hypothetical protein
VTQEIGHPEPPGMKFFDAGSEREMILVTGGWCAGWLCYQHPGGQWVTLREATPEDRRKVEEHERVKRDAIPFNVRNRAVLCPGHGEPYTGPRCCDRAGEYNGFGSDGPLAFTCPKHCSCHD